jgi:hypothetical protein
VPFDARCSIVNHSFNFFSFSPSLEMSAPSIPNLNAFRRGGIRSRGSGRAAAGAPGTGGGQQRQVHRDALVQNTDGDAAGSRLSAVSAGYLEDSFAALLHPEQSTPRRLPLMNRGRHTICHDVRLSQLTPHQVLMSERQLLILLWTLFSPLLAISASKSSLLEQGVIPGTSD